MDRYRRTLVLAPVALGVLGIVPALAGSADDEAVAKNVDAFRTAQIAADAKALDALCAAGWGLTGLVSWACAYAEVTRSAAPMRIIVLVRMLVAPRYRRKKLPDGWFDP